MPIYAYRCAACGHQKDVLQKLSDAPLSTCPECGQPAFSKQVTAPAFQLKGTGWYVTDFRDGGKGKPGEAKTEVPAKDGAKEAGGDAAKSDTPAPAADAAKPAATPAASPAPAPAPAPAGGGASTGGTTKAA